MLAVPVIRKARCNELLRVAAGVVSCGRCLLRSGWSCAAAKIAPLLRAQITRSRHLSETIFFLTFYPYKIDVRILGSHFCGVLWVLAAYRLPCVASVVLTRFRLTKQIGRKSRDKVSVASDVPRSGSSGGAATRSSRTACAAAVQKSGAASSGTTSSSNRGGSRGAAPGQQPGGANRRSSREPRALSPSQASALKDVRVIQRCLAYVVGIPPSIAKKEVSRRAGVECFVK